MEFFNQRLQQQFQFLMELDKLKSVFRRSILSHEKRLENSGEHSWHVTVVAMLLYEYANEAVDLLKIMKMLLIHDVVEIDAGDTYIYDKVSNAGKVDRERKAAERIFGLLPEDQAREFRELWEEFENKETPEAKFAGSCDRLIPLLHNYHAKGHSWQEHGVEMSNVYEINQAIEKGSSLLWEAASKIIKESVEKGYLKG
jgi:putative hydrolases of HD superfamily